VIRILNRHPIQPRGRTARIAKLFRDLLDEMVKASLAKRVRGVALAFRGRLGPGQTVEDKMGKRLKGVGDIAFDLGLSSVEGIHPRQQPPFQNRARLGIEPGSKRALAMPKLSPFANLPRTHSPRNVIHSHSHLMIKEAILLLIFNALQEGYGNDRRPIRQLRSVGESNDARRTRRCS
jgi:hypothetical protein